MNIKENYRVCGARLDHFEQECKNISDSTRYIRVESADLELYSFYREEVDYYAFRKIDYESHMAFRLNDQPLPIVRIRKNDCSLSKELMEELMRGTGLLVSANKSTFFVANNAIGTMSIRAGAAGTRISRPGICRDLFLADGLFERNEDLVLVVRDQEDEEGKRWSKVFAFMTERMKEIPMTLLPKVVELFAAAHEEIGEAKVDLWECEHDLTRIYLEFPEQKDDFAEIYKLPSTPIPGLILQMSDTGTCSFTAYGTARTGSTPVIVSEYKRMHTGEVRIESLLEKVDEHIFRDFRKMPEALAELLGNEVPKEQKKEYLFTGLDALELNKLLGKKRVARIKEALEKDVEHLELRTEYDICIFLMSLGDSIRGLSKKQKEELSKLLGKAPYVSYTPEPAAPTVTFIPFIGHEEELTVKEAI